MPSRLSLSSFRLPFLILLFSMLAIVSAVRAPSRAAAFQDQCTIFYFPLTVSSESALNEAIDCFNLIEIPGIYLVTLSAHITLSDATTTINNSSSGMVFVLDGAGYALDGNHNSGVRPLSIAAGTVVTVSELTVIGGRVPSGSGGGIENLGNLTLEDSTVSGNSAGESGGGIENLGNLTLKDSTVSGNSAQSGGGIAGSGTTAVIRSTISGNTAGESGGGISDSAVLTVQRSTISGNSAGDSGGGLAISGSQAALSNSTVSGNIATSGGGLFFSGNGAVVLTNVTVSANDVSGQGAAGGIETAVSASDSGSVSLSNTIVAEQGSGADCAAAANTSLAVTSQGYNLDSDYSCGLSKADHDIPGGSADLGALQDNGGPTFTQGLQSGSDALDAADNSVCAADPVFDLDQRGFPRPVNSTCDIGAHEAQTLAQLQLRKSTTPAGGSGFPFVFDPGPYDFVNEWGSSGGLNGEFMGALGTAVAADGSVYVADTGNNRVQVFDSAGNLLFMIGGGVDDGGGDVCTLACVPGVAGSGLGEFNAPQDVAVDSDGIFYVADSGNNRIQKFEAGGYPIGVSVQVIGSSGSLGGQFRRPTGVALDSADNLYVVDQSNNRVQKLDSTGAFLRAWGWDVLQGQSGDAFEICVEADDCQSGRSGSGSGAFTGPTSVAVSQNGTVYVADQGNRRLQSFTSNGAQPADFGDTIARPGFVAVDAAGNVYASNISAGVVLKLDAAGDQLAELDGRPGTQPFSAPEGVAVDGEGRVIVVDSGNHRVVTLAPELSTALDDGGSELFVLPAGDYLVSELLPGGWFVSGTNCGSPIEGAEGSAVSPAVSVTLSGFVNCTFSNEAFARLTIAKQTESSGGDFPFTVDPGEYALSHQWGSQGMGGAGQFFGPQDTALDGAGALYVVEAGNRRVQKFSKSGAFELMFGKNVDGAGNNVCTANCQQGEQGSGPGEFSSPAGVAADSRGNVYVTDAQNNTLQAFDSSGRYVATLAGSGTLGGQLNGPRGVALDASGNIYVVEIISNRVQKLGPDGEFISAWGWDVDQGGPSGQYEICTVAAQCQRGSVGSGAGQFANPVDVAVGPDGRVFVADLNNDRVQIFDADGNLQGVLGDGSAAFTAPISIDADAAGNVYVADYERSETVKFNAAGDTLGKVGDVAFPASVSVDGEGTVYVVNNMESAVVVLTPPWTAVLDHNQSATVDLLPGSYLISELLPPGWSLTGITCDTASQTVGFASTSLTLAHGAQHTCTFTNQAALSGTEPASIKLVESYAVSRVEEARLGRRGSRACYWITSSFEPVDNVTVGLTFGSEVTTNKDRVILDASNWDNVSTAERSNFVCIHAVDDEVDDGGDEVCKDGAPDLIGAQPTDPAYAECGDHVEYIAHRVVSSSDSAFDLNTPFVSNNPSMDLDDDPSTVDVLVNDDDGER